MTWDTWSENEKFQIGVEHHSEVPNTLCWNIDRKVRKDLFTVIFGAYQPIFGCTKMRSPEISTLLNSGPPNVHIFGTETTDPSLIFRPV